MVERWADIAETLFCGEEDKGSTFNVSTANEGKRPRSLPSSTRSGTRSAAVLPTPVLLAKSLRLFRQTVQALSVAGGSRGAALERKRCSHELGEVGNA